MPTEMKPGGAKFFTSSKEYNDYVAAFKEGYLRSGRNLPNLSESGVIMLFRDYGGSYAYMARAGLRRWPVYFPTFSNYAMAFKIEHIGNHWR